MGKVPATSRNERYSAPYQLTQLHIVAVVNIDAAEWRSVHPGCIIQVEPTRLGSHNNITLRYGCESHVLVY